MTYFALKHETARKRAVQACKEAPDDWIVTIKPPNRTLEQNAAIHACLSEAGELLRWKFNGQTVDLDDVKTIFMAAYRKAQKQEMRFVVGLDGQPVILNWRTRDLSKKEASELIEMVEAWKANYQPKENSDVPV